MPPASREDRPRGLPGGRRLSDGRHLYWWAEVLAILVFYGVYSFARNANEGGARVALEHARDVMRWQEMLGINVERSLQEWALGFRPLIVFLNYVYGSLHFAVTIGVIVYLFVRHTDAYPRWRNALAVTTLLALVGFVFWPLMPPRLLPAHYGFVDTLARYPTLWSFNSGTMSEISNQYAAMPSLHFAWSLFCACGLAPRLSSPTARAVALGYPVLTLAAIVLTGNHYFLDAVGGAAVFGAGYAVSARFTRPVRPEPSRDDATVGS